LKEYRFTWLFVVSVLVFMLVSSAAHAAAPAVEKLLPEKGDVPGFTIMSDSLNYGKGEGITSIYDGGYELYTRNGVVDAARQMYQRRKDFVEVTVHTMKSEKAAKDFVKYWAKERQVSKVTTSKRATGFVTVKPNVMAYYAMGKYFVTVSAFYPAERATKDVNAFINVIESRSAK